MEIQPVRKVLLCFRMPHGTYCGGVASIINSYMDHRAVFHQHGADVALLDYVAPVICRKLPSKFSNVLYGLLQRRAVLKQLHKTPADTVHIHTSRDFLYLKDIWLARSIKRRCGIPVCVTVHVGAAQTVFSRIGFARNTSIRWINRYVDRVIFLSAGLQQEFQQLGMEPERGAVLENFHDLEPLPAENVLPRAAKLHLLFVGAIHREKGILELMQALEDLDNQNIHLDICGTLTDASIQTEFEARVARLGSRVTLHGYVTGQKKAALFQRADALVLPSYHEGFPLVILEALAGGCGIISTEVGATPGILRQENALWVEIANSGDIARAVKLLREQPERLAKMQQENLRLSEAYSLGRHIEKLCRIYGS